MLLDLEHQQVGEGEVATALRLLERVLIAYPRAFDVLLADALYAVEPFLNFLLAHGRTRWWCLKMSVAMRIRMPPDCGPAAAPPGSYASRRCRWWDIPDLLSWPEVKGATRVVRSEESWTVKAQLTKEVTQQTGNWVWMTTLSVAQAPTEQLGH